MPGTTNVLMETSMGAITIELDGDSLRCSGPNRAERSYDMQAGYRQSYAAAIARTGNAAEREFLDRQRSGGLGSG